MKTIRSLMTLAGLSLVIFALGVTGAQAQQAPSLSITHFGGTFTLPMEAQWGKVTLPAGQYSLYYGSVQDGSASMVEVVGKAKGSPHGLIPVAGKDDASAANSALVCIREGVALIVRTLEMPAIGTAAQFSMPNGSRLVARNASHNGYTQLAEGPVLLQRISITLNAN
jgi:hypothetical protein